MIATRMVAPTNLRGRVLRDEWDVFGGMWMFCVRIERAN